MYSYEPRGVCPISISFDLDENHTIKGVNFIGGCNGNLKAISALVEGRKAEDVVATLKDIKCGFKQTSCAAELSKAIERVLEESRNYAY